MFELVYYSIINTQKGKTSIQIMDEILSKSREFNSHKNITGCLLFRNNVFLQLLEGKKEDVQNLYSSIKKDNRHSNVTLIIEQDVEERMFPDWSMAFYESTNTNADMNQFIKNIIFFSENSDKQTEATDLFLRMAKHISIK
ncbi:BLUF domain-containing protein [uncultured Polaribacter sp.]|uniref:BLUF domain-containing protein n=1 Tax=uncultured Polaribacter sp. TaxID=174711 RepID=UPI0030DB714D|tara:strand:+ start:60554 stop:60976 length:423 start_codon:yes stop_codon:yes gene_type:complete